MGFRRRTWSRTGVVGAIAMISALSACDTPTADAIARDQAKGVVDGIAAQQFPGADVSPVTDCIIDSASSSELIEIASAAVTGVTQSTTTLVTQIATRPETITCYTENAAPALLGSLLAAS